MGAKQSEEDKIVSNYIVFLKNREKSLNLNELHCMKYERVIEIMKGWKNLGVELFSKQLESSLYNQTVKEIIRRLQQRLSEINPEDFIRTFQNKCTIEEFMLLDQPNERFQLSLNSKTQVNQCQEHVEELMQQTRKKRKIRTILKQHQTQQTFKKYIIEKEVLQQDHFIMIIVNQYCKLVMDQGSSLCTNSINSTAENYKQIVRFVTKFQLRMIKEIYQTDDIDPDIAIKSIFQNVALYEHLLDIMNFIHQDEIQLYQKNLRLQQRITFQDLGADQIYQMPEKENRYQQVVDQLNFIMKVKCPVKKFEQIGKLKLIIIKSLDDYQQEFYINFPKQIQVDSDHFLIILIYALIQQNQPNFLVHIKLIQFIMSKQIEIDRGQHSWIFVSILAAITHILEEKSMTKNSLQNCLETVIESQIYLE